MRTGRHERGLYEEEESKDFGWGYVRGGKPETSKEGGAKAASNGVLSMESSWKTGESPEGHEPYGEIQGKVANLLKVQV